jgi:hypothetical protein
MSRFCIKISGVTDQRRAFPSECLGDSFALQTSGTMETNWIRKLYEPSPVPTLYVGRTEDLLGRVPLFPCFLDGNATSSIPYKLIQVRASTEAGLLIRKCKPGITQGQPCSWDQNLDVELWQASASNRWLFGPEVLVTKTERIRRKFESEGPRRAYKTRQARNGPEAFSWRGRVQQNRNDIYIYTWYILVIYKCWVNHWHAFEGILWCSPPQYHDASVHADLNLWWQFLSSLLPLM